MAFRFKLGDWEAICDVCGFKFKAEQLRQRWDGLMTCHKDWEPRHPMDFFRMPEERISVPWSRPEAADTFVQQGGPITTEQGQSDDYWITTESGNVITTE